MSSSEAVSAADAITKAFTALLEGRELEAVAHALDAVFVLLPDGDLLPYLSEAAIRRAKILKDAADGEKFGRRAP